MVDFVNLAASAIATAIAALVAIGTIIAAIYGLGVYIDARVAKRLQDRETLDALAIALRPSVIFNSDNVVLADLGAMAMIDSIKVEPVPPNDPQSSEGYSGF